MSEKWIVILSCWIICAVVAIVTKAPVIMLIPAIGTFLAVAE